MGRGVVRGLGGRACYEVLREGTHEVVREWRKGDDEGEGRKQVLEGGSERCPGRTSTEAPSGKIQGKRHDGITDEDLNNVKVDYQRIGGWSFGRWIL